MNHENRLQENLKEISRILIISTIRLHENLTHTSLLSKISSLMVRYTPEIPVLQNLGTTGQFVCRFFFFSFLWMIICPPVSPHQVSPNSLLPFYHSISKVLHASRFWHILNLMTQLLLTYHAVNQKKGPKTNLSWLRHKCKSYLAEKLMLSMNKEMESLHFKCRFKERNKETRRWRGLIVY